MPTVSARKQADKSFYRKLRQIHILIQPARHRFSRLVAGPDDAPDAAVFAVDAFGIGLGVLVAGIFFVPIHDPHGTIWPGLDPPGAEPVVVTGEEGAAAHLVIRFARAG